MSPVILWTHYVLILVVADVIAMLLLYLTTCVFVLAVVIASCFVLFMADGDVIAIWLVFCWQMLLPFVFVAVGITT